MIDFSKLQQHKQSASIQSPRGEDAPVDANADTQVSSGEAFSGQSSGEQRDLFSHKKVNLQELLIRAQRLYGQGLSLAEELLIGDSGRPQVDTQKIFSFVKELIKGVDNQELIGLVFSSQTVSESYLSSNLLHVCIFSLLIGKQLGLEQETLYRLGVASFVHDIGMRSCSGIAGEAKRLSIVEYQQIKQHPQQGKKLLQELMPDADISILTAIEQEHERIDGSGYPQGITGAQIHEFAQIIGVADVYEALIHARPYRPALVALDTVELLMKGKKTFNHRMIKSLLESVGLYPRGTAVELNTEEKAFVLRQNKGLPHAPIIRIVLDGHGKSLEEIKEVDLSRNPAIYIVKSIKNLPTSV